MGLCDLAHFCVRGSFFLCRHVKYLNLKSVPIYILNRIVNYRSVNFHPETNLDVFVENWFLAGLLQLLVQTRNVVGDIIELGTYRGGTTMVMALFLKKLGSNKQVYTCDTFKGHPYDGLSLIGNSRFRRGDFSDTSVHYVRRKCLKHGVDDNVIVVEGLFEETLYEKLGDKRFSFAFIDCDLYQSTKFGLNFLVTRMANKAIIAFHDYGHPRCLLAEAVHEACAKHDFKVKLHPIPHIQF